MNKSRLLVVVLGYFQSDRRHLEKYRSLYKRITPGKGELAPQTEENVEQSGNRVLMFTAKWYHYLAGKIGFRIYGRYVLNQVDEVVKRQESDGSDVGIIFHVMSNNGGLLYAAVRREMDSSQRYEPLKQRTCGVVFDSCPGPLTIDIAFKVAAELAKGSKAKSAMRSLPILGVLALALVSKTWMRTALILGMIVSIEHFFFRNILLDRITRDKLECPLLFIASKSDHIIPFSELEKVVEAKRKSRSDDSDEDTNIELVKFQGTAHVQHYRSQPMLYEDTILEFINHKAWPYHHQSSSSIDSRADQ